MSNRCTEKEKTLDQDRDPAETREWLDALDSVEAFEGIGRVDELLDGIVQAARRKGAKLPFAANTAYVNTISPDNEPAHPGDRAIEHKIRSLIRWNAAAIVLRANKTSSELGGHIASFQSAATLYDTGFMHFWHAPTDTHGGDLVYYQGHCSPGIYARAYLEGRLSEEQLLNFRQEVDGKGMPSYPHPWLMPDFWQFPTVSMGLGPLMAIYQARFLKYLDSRGLADTKPPQGLGLHGRRRDGRAGVAWRHIAGRTRASRQSDLCHQLQSATARWPGAGKRQDHTGTRGRFPRRGLERHQGPVGIRAGINCWPTTPTGILRKRMEECVDGEYQDYKSKNGAYVREHFFGKYPELKTMVAHMSDDQIWELTRGGHDPRKVYAAYKAATEHKGQPTVILAKTVKGYGMGESGEGQMISHQAKKMNEEALRQFRDRFAIPVSDEQLKDVPFVRFPEGSPEMKYLAEHRAALGGHLPARRGKSQPIEVPPLSAFSAQLKSTGDREISTTMAFVRILTTLLRDKAIGKRIVPIVPDESRTFGMEGMFRQFGIFSQVGQLYRPQDADATHVLPRGQDRSNSSRGD